MGASRVSLIWTLVSFRHLHERETRISIFGGPHRVTYSTYFAPVAYWKGRCCCCCILTMHYDLYLCECYAHYGKWLRDVSRNSSCRLEKGKIAIWFCVGFIIPRQSYSRSFVGLSFLFRRRRRRLLFEFVIFSLSTSLGSLEFHNRRRFMYAMRCPLTFSAHKGIEMRYSECEMWLRFFCVDFPFSWLFGFLFHSTVVRIVELGVSMRDSPASLSLSSVGARRCFHRD